MLIEYNPNPTGRKVEDCAIRAVCKALGWEWDKAYAIICSYGLGMGDMPHSNSVWGAVLRENGFVRDAIDNTCPDCYTIEDFANDNPSGTFVVVANRHTVCVEDGNVYDTWDSRSEIPQFYWRRKDQ